jgi:hypothetical protein
VVDVRVQQLLDRVGRVVDLQDAGVEAVGLTDPLAGPGGGQGYRVLSRVLVKTFSK